MAVSAYSENLCNVFNRQSELSCKQEDLYLLEDLGSVIEPETEKEKKILLLGCRICGQVYKESTTVYNNTPYRSYDKIKGQRIDQCHCIGYLEEEKVLFEERLCEGDNTYFSWNKQTLMRCKKCGRWYKEIIIQSNYDSFYSRKYEQASET